MKKEDKSERDFVLEQLEEHVYPKFTEEVVQLMTEEERGDLLMMITRSKKSGLISSETYDRLFGELEKVYLKKIRGNK